MKKEDPQIKAYMGENTVFNGSLSFDGTVRIDGKFEGKVHTDDTLIVGTTGHLIAEIHTLSKRRRQESYYTVCKRVIKKQPEFFLRKLELSKPEIGINIQYGSSATGVKS